MATPDLRALYELYGQMFDGKAGLVEPVRSDHDVQHSGYDFAQLNEPRGGVFSGLTAPAVPKMPQTPFPAGASPRAPLSTLPLGLGRGLPMPLGPSQFVEIPNPHLERLIPEATRNFWAAAALLPWILARGSWGMASRMKALSSRTARLYRRVRLNSRQMVAAVRFRGTWAHRYWKRSAGGRL